MNALLETIVALSSPVGRSAIALIRISGPESNRVGGELIRGFSPSHRKMNTGTLRTPKEGQSIDRVNYTFMKGPDTFTGEDTLEIFPHGNPLIIREILSIVTKIYGVREAEPGEFTRRALENGKIDLIQAEGIGEIIHAENLLALRNAQKLMNGELSQSLNRIDTRINSFLPRLELDVDFMEEEADPEYAKWIPEIQDLEREIEILAGSWETNKKWFKIPKVIFFGAPNAGKSSLINSLLKKERVLVSKIAGTTRDYIEVPIALPRGNAILVDTAGLNEATDELDALAIQKTRSVLEEADYKVLVEDGTIPQTSGMAQFDLRVATRCDLPNFISQVKTVPVSNLTGEGIQQLMEYLTKGLYDFNSRSSDLALATERQYQCAKRALNCIRNALGNLQGVPAAEIVAFEMREARNQFSELLGAYRPQETLNKIFSNFCIGK